MQITQTEVTPVDLKLTQPLSLAGAPVIERVAAIFVRIETREGHNAFGCAVAHPDLTGESPEAALRFCRDAAAMTPDLHPTNLEYSLDQLSVVTQKSPAAACAFDLAFHDLLGLAAGMPLYRLLGGYRNRIQTSITIPLAPLQESVEIAESRAGLGFRILKIKGGLDPQEDVERVKAIRRLLPHHTLRLDADGGYHVQAALDVARALADVIEMLEQPTPPADLEALGEVTRHSKVPILADQSVSGPDSALELAAGCLANGLSVKMAACGGLRCARQVDSIARAARLSSMVSCLIEPALLIAAGLHFALSSPNVRYGDLDGHLVLANDPTQAGFKLEEGWLESSERPGLGCTVEF